MYVGVGLTATDVGWDPNPGTLRADVTVSEIIFLCGTGLLFALPRMWRARDAAAEADPE